MSWILRGLILAAVCGLPAAWAGEVLDRIQSHRVLRVCIWPDYYGITYRHPQTQQLVGMDIELSTALARELQVRVEHVDSSFVTLIADLTSDRCDVAMFAVGVLPQRQEKLRFTQPYMRSDIYAVTTKSNRVVRQWSDIDAPGVQVAVQAGTFMEPVMAQRLRHAQLVRVQPPATRERELMAGRVDVFMTDFPYSRRMLETTDWARLVSPTSTYHMTEYAYAVAPGDLKWFNRVEQFVRDIKRDGRLLRAASRYRLESIVVPN